jgi:glycine/D-amino acid oxidase-like deaminating enzyme
MEREPATGISAVVVGAGIGGLTFAIEAHRKGHNVRVIERSPEGQYSGQYTAITAGCLWTDSCHRRDHHDHDSRSSHAEEVARLHAARPSSSVLSEFRAA